MPCLEAGVALFDRAWQVPNPHLGRVVAALAHCGLGRAESDDEAFLTVAKYR